MLQKSKGQTHTRAHTHSQKVWKRCIQTLTDHNYKLKLLYPTKLSTKFEGDINFSVIKNSFKEFMTTKAARQRILEGIPQSEEKGKDTGGQKE